MLNKRYINETTLSIFCSYFLFSFETTHKLLFKETIFFTRDLNLGTFYEKLKV